MIQNRSDKLLGMTRDTSSSFGVSATIVQNLTGEEIRISWWPEKHGEGRILGPHQKVRFAGNLFEEVYANPKLKAAMDADTTSGRVAVAACGTLSEEDKYPVLDNQAQPGFQTHGCIQWEYNSSSSMWVEE